MMAAVAGTKNRTSPVRVFNPAAEGWLVLICDHASNFVPEQYGTLGLAPEDLERHIAWDPGAAPVARILAEKLDAVLVESAVSRLIVDCNRPLDAPDLIPATSETTEIPANRNLPEAERARRIALSHAPFHAAVDAVVRQRLEARRPCALVSIHSFTPVYRGVKRPWHVGIIHDDDMRLGRPIISALERIDGITVGDNQPYSPADRVYFSLEIHAREFGLPCAMVEIRNDEISDAAGQALWADRFATILSGIQEPDLTVGKATARNAKGHRRLA